jgi:SAM-dependent methyltransferase
MRLAFAWGWLRRRRNASAEPSPLLHPFDQRYGVQTGGLIQGDQLRSGHRNDAFNTAYYGMAPSRFESVMKSWLADESHPAIENYTFIDIGCGKGRAVLMASRFRFREVIGVELHASLAQIAEANFAAWKRVGRALCPVRIVCQDATEFRFPEGPCLLYLFHPFTAPVLKQLIDRIEIQFASRPGILDLIYFNPEAGELLDTHGRFKLLWTGTVAMSEEDAAVDLVASAGDLCSVYRWLG